MYSSRGSSAYGQSYGGQSAYGQNLGPAYSGGSVGGPDVGQHSVASRHSSILGGTQDVDVGGYRAHSSTATQYGGQYSSVYGSASLSSAQQVPSLSAKGAAPSALEGRGGYTLGVPDSPKFASGDYSSSSHAYAHKSDQLYAEKVLDYSGIDRRQYGERQSAYMGRDLASDATGRYAADPVGFSHQHQPEIYDRMDQAALLRQEQLMKAQSLQSASLDGSTRQTEYLAARAAASRHPTQDLMSYGGRMDTDPRGSSMLTAASYSGQHAPSLLGAAPRRNVDDLLYSQSASNPGYGVSLPPGRDYASGKGLHSNAMELDYPGTVLPRGGHNDRKDDRASYLREFELQEEERRRERFRERERDREREKERERLRERERERERERKRERERILERREKERERERKRVLDIRHERTPVRSSKDPRGTSKDPRGSSLTKEGRSSQRDSPHHEASHRHHSPVKEKRREYVCKVYPSSLVDIERDYLSIDKRYPRLFVSPEFSKAVVNWPKDNLKLSIHTPVSFEHDFADEESATEPKDTSAKLLMGGSSSSEQGNTVWNAKIILMSGLSRSALEDLSSDKSIDDRVPHISNILRFAVLKKDHSFMAVGGPWESADGGDPSIDNNSLIRTAHRYAKDVIQLDLQNCQHWNRFLEIHYDRIGKDGLFSHKEVTVLFVPNLSDCLPSLDAWRDQWLTHKKAVAEREHQLYLKREKSRDNKEASKDKSEKKKDSASSGPPEDVKKKEKDSNNVKKEAEEKTGGINNKLAKNDGAVTGEEGKNVEKKEQGETATAQATGSLKSVKKKIIKKVVKQKVANKASDTASKQMDKPEEKDGAEKMASNIPAQEDKSSVNPSGVDTSLGKTNGEEDKGIQHEVKETKEINSSEDISKDQSDPTVNAVVNTAAKTTKKKKIIRRVPKKKVTGEAFNSVVPDPKNDDKNVVAVQVDETQSTGQQTADADTVVTEVKKTEKVVPKIKSKTPASKKQDNVVDSNKTEKKSDKDDNKDEKGTAEKSGAEMEKQKASEKDNHNGKGKMKDGDKSKDEKGTKEKDEKDGSKSKYSKEAKEKRKSEEPPRHPGFILQTKWSKGSKLRPLSLSLDSLLDYTDKDIEESTFELSLFAESLYEMLQYQMGCRILTFLQKLRIKFVMKRTQRKRLREDDHEKEIAKKSPIKRLKGDDPPVKSESANLDTSNTTLADNEKSAAKDDNSVDKEDVVKMEDGTDEEEDPEEDPEEYEEMENESIQHDSSSEKNVEQKTNLNIESQNIAGNEKEADETNNGEAKDKGATESKSDIHSNEEKEGKVNKSKKDAPAVKETAVDKELLQAFRFFDRNRVGFIRVEDMRLIIHNLGKFLSHRDVKELVQSALLESNTGRDDRILYNKLVRMNEI